MCFIAIVLAACSDTDLTDSGSVDKTTGNSYASVKVKFPKGASLTKALPQGQGSWTGRDVIENVTVFLVNTANNVVDFNSFTTGSFNAIDANGVLSPNLALRATAGQNIRVYTVINGSPDVLNMLKLTQANGFASAFAGEASKIASDVAKYNAPVPPATQGTETIMMTNDEDNYTITVIPGVTQADALTGTSNHAIVKVERVASRALLTVEPATSNVWAVTEKVNGTDTQIAKITSVTYGVGQSNKKFFIMKQSDYRTPNPVYNFVPSGNDWALNNAYFDYSGLNFTQAQEFSYNVANINDPLNNESTSKFILPVNHAVHLTNPTAQRPFYKKGNTTYFEVRAAFIPNELDGAPYTSQQPTTVFWNSGNKKFYTTRVLAEAEGGRATKFENGVMKFVLWLNPNAMATSVDDPNPVASPTYRNEVYHAHVSDFHMGLPNNPLNPEDPNDPENPENPIDPNDPLKSDRTYLSVSVKVIPWTIRSNKYSLTDDMY